MFDYLMKAAADLYETALGIRGELIVASPGTLSPEEWRDWEDHARILEISAGEHVGAAQLVRDHSVVKLIEELLRTPDLIILKETVADYLSTLDCGL